MASLAGELPLWLYIAVCILLYVYIAVCILLYVYCCMYINMSLYTFIVIIYVYTLIYKYVYMQIYNLYVYNIYIHIYILLLYTIYIYCYIYIYMHIILLYIHIIHCCTMNSARHFFLGCGNKEANWLWPGETTRLSPRRWWGSSAMPPGRKTDGIGTLLQIPSILHQYSILPSGNLT